jgi:hypothetical protein
MTGQIWTWLGRGLAIALCPILGSCSLSENRFVNRWVQLQCTTLSACDPTNFEAEWSTIAYCETELERAWQEVIDGYEASDCTYYSDAASDCLEDAEDATCEDWESWAWYDAACFHIWQCDIPFQDTGTIK